jgi:hypothetical protein
MDRSGLYLMVLGFLLSWPVPVVGVIVMILGGLVTAIALERTLLPELAGTPEPFDEQSLERRAAS